MSVESQYELMKKLRALADHPDTPLEEADSARRRIDEIDRRIRETHERIEAERSRLNAAIEEKKRARKAAIRSIRNRKPSGKTPREFPSDWPFGWDSPKNRVEMEEMFAANGSIVLGWKCPGCSGHVERVITPRHKARLRGKPGGVDGFLESIRDGTLNQLCDRCWADNR